MHGVEGEVEEERILRFMLPLDEGGGLLAEGDRQVTLLVHRFAIAQNGGVVFALSTRLDDVLMPAPDEAEELIETAIHRRETFGRAQVPLAHHARHVARRLEPLRKRMGLRGQRPAEVLNAVAMLIPATHQRRAGRRAERSVRIRIGEAHPTLREPVNVRRRNVFATVGTDVGIAEIIGEDDDDVGFLLWRIGS